MHSTKSIRLSIAAAGYHQRMRIRGDRPFHALLQFTYAFRTGDSINQHSNGNRFDKDILTKIDIVRIEEALRGSLSKKPDPLYLPSQDCVRRHSWLGEHSRHAGIGVPCYFTDPKKRPPEPADFAEERAAPFFESYVRVQRARTGNGDLDPGYIDCNDFMVSSSAPDGRAQLLSTLREFFAFSYSRRRGDIFGSALSDRMYNIWLPAAVLKEKDTGHQFAILPVATRVRMPYRRDLRPTIAVSTLFVPVSADWDKGKMDKRKMNVAEAAALVRATGGSSTQVPQRPVGNPHIYTLEGPLWRWFKDELDEKSFPTTCAIITSKRLEAQMGTLRQWLELIGAAVAEMTASPNRDRPAKSSRADEILQAIRLSGAWSVLALIPGVQAAKTPSDAGMNSDGQTSPQDNSRQCVPPAAGGLIAEINGEELNVPFARLDDARCGFRSLGSWSIPERSCLVSAYDNDAEHFPSTSMLNAFPWLGYMLIGIASARTIVRALGHAVERSASTAVREVAAQSHQLTLELEEMYDLDIAWDSYARIYARLRQQWGVEQQHRRARQRAEVLAEHVEVIARSRQEEFLKELQVVAGVATLVIIGLAVLQVIIGLAVLKIWTGHDPLWGIAATGVGVVILGLVYFTYIRSREKPPRTPNGINLSGDGHQPESDHGDGVSASASSAVLRRGLIVLREDFC